MFLSWPNINYLLRNEVIAAHNEDIPAAIPSLIDAVVAAFDADRNTSRRHLLRASALLRIKRRACADAAEKRGGLLAWQLNRVTDYTEAHLADKITISGGGPARHGARTSDRTLPAGRAAYTQRASSRDPTCARDSELFGEGFRDGEAKRRTVLLLSRGLHTRGATELNLGRVLGEFDS